jgi:proline racemase
MKVQAVDYHPAGEPFRIVAEPPVVIDGATVPQCRVYAMADPEADGLRRVLCLEPRGHPLAPGFVVR